MKKNKTQLLINLAWVMLMLLGPASCSLETDVPVNRTLILNDCILSSSGQSVHLTAKCGVLEVYENRSANSGKTIPLQIAVIPAVSRSPKPDPIFFLAGGPGEAASQSYFAVASAFVRLNMNRDIVLVDQRGTGGSNFLDCPENKVETAAGSDQTIADQVRACLAALPGDPRWYTTPIAMQDLDQVRKALGYSQINLYGASYGTRAAQVYARMYPENTRSLVLDGVVPLDLSIGPDSLTDAQASLEKIFQRCQDEPACRQTFPETETDFKKLIQRMESSPGQYILPEPLTGEPQNNAMTAAGLAEIVHLISYSSETAVLLPLMIHQAYRWEDFTAFALLGQLSMENLVSGLSTGMRLSVLCNEDVPFWPEKPSGESYLDAESLLTLQNICQVWPKADLPAEYKTPLQTALPVLMVSGEADPVTPPRNAQHAAQSLPNSLSIVLPGEGHINITRGCVPSLLYQFIANGSNAGLDAACIDGSKPMSFFLNINGPQP